MARLRRMRLTRPKKGQSKQATIIPGGDPTGPTEDEWRSMKPYKSFVVIDDEDREHVFPVGKTAMIMPEDREPGDDIKQWEYWVGRINEIRSRGEDTSDVWARVRWFWSPTEVATSVKTFDATRCGKYERLLSNNFDFVHSTCFQALVNVIKYDESNAEQEYIKFGTFYYRYTYDFMKHQIKPKPNGTCICHKPYSPDAPEIMHFCPRPMCLKAYHPCCLIDIGWQAKRPKCAAAPRGILFERTLPDSETNEPDTKDLEPPPKRPRGRPRKNTPAIDSEAPKDGSYATIPEELLDIARSPIVKGKPTGSIVGNVASVIEARKMVRLAVNKALPVPEDWKRKLSVSGRAIDSLCAEDTDLLCPGCGGPI